MRTRTLLLSAGVEDRTRAHRGDRARAAGGARRPFDLYAMAAAHGVMSMPLMRTSIGAGGGGGGGAGAAAGGGPPPSRPAPGAPPRPAPPRPAPPRPAPAGAGGGMTTPVSIHGDWAVPSPFENNRLSSASGQLAPPAAPPRLRWPRNSRQRPPRTASFIVFSFEQSAWKADTTMARQTPLKANGPSNTIRLRRARERARRHLSGDRRLQSSQSLSECVPRHCQLRAIRELLVELARVNGLSGPPRYRSSDACTSVRPSMRSTSTMLRILSKPWASISGRTRS